MHLLHLVPFQLFAPYKHAQVTSYNKVDKAKFFQKKGEPVKDTLIKGWLNVLHFLHTLFFYWIFRSISVSGQLPTHPSPNPTTVNWQQVKVNVGLGEG